MEKKYPVVLRVDGTVPPWDWFVLGANDPAALDALTAYAASCAAYGYDPAYVDAIRARVVAWRADLVSGNDPSLPTPERERDPLVARLAASPSLDACLAELGLDVEGVVASLTSAPS